MKATYIDYSDTNSFSETLLSYLSKDNRLESFISCWPELKNFDELILKRKNIDRSLLVKVLQQQYSDQRYQSQASNLVNKNISLLAHSNTFTITTGHQLNIFTGPLYFIFKIVTAINLANELKEAHPDKHFVPVYWMATEDHDFEEINHTYIKEQKFSWDENVSGATGRINPSTIKATVKTFLNALGYSENSKKLEQIINEAYLNHSTLADATRYLVHSLFKDYGLVILDADDPELKKQFSDIIKDDILEQKSFKSISKSSESLQKLGFKTQVQAREINFFYLADNLRERIVYEDESWKVLNTSISFNKKELCAEIDQHPERFSPNVVMRPLYQEVILPNLAYVGGGAEIIYWLQLKNNFNQYGIDFPVLILRNSALLTKETTSIKLNRLGLSVADLFKNLDSVKKQWVLSHSEHTLNLIQEIEEFQVIFDRLKQRAAKIDSTLAPSTEAIKIRLEKALCSLERKLIKAEKRNHEGALRQLDNLKNDYFPANSLQERRENFGPFYAQFGDEFIAELAQHFKPLDFKFTILES